MVFGQTQRADSKGTSGAPKGTLPFGKGLARTLMPMLHHHTCTHAHKFTRIIVEIQVILFTV